VTHMPESDFEYDHESWYDLDAVRSGRELHEQRHRYQQVQKELRPVYGILAEPMRGGLFKKGEDKENIKVDADIYIPRAHVQFLE